MSSENLRTFNCFNCKGDGEIEEQELVTGNSYPAGGMYMGNGVYVTCPECNGLGYIYDDESDATGSNFSN